jgi:hypothetical protein
MNKLIIHYLITKRIYFLRRVGAPIVGTAGRWGPLAAGDRWPLGTAGRWGPLAAGDRWPLGFSL